MRLKYGGRYVPEWQETFTRITAPKKHDAYAHRTVCVYDIKVATSGVYDFKDQFKSKLQQQNANQMQNQPQRVYSVV